MTILPAWKQMLMLKDALRARNNLGATLNFYYAEGDG